MTMSGSATSDSSASESEDSDPFAQPTDKQFVIPSPIKCCGIEADASHCQYRTEMARKPTDDHSLNEEDDEEQDIDGNEEEESCVPFDQPNSRAADDIFRNVSI